MMAGPTSVPKLVRDTLAAEGAYDFGLGVVLRAPTDPRGTGARASYRVEYRFEPVIPGRPKAARQQRYTRDLAKAYELASHTFEEMQQRAGGTYVEYHTDVAFGQVVWRWFDSPHPRWGAQYPDKVTSLLRNWVTAPDVTIAWRAGGAPTPIADVPSGALTADHYNQALEHVRGARAHRTYTEVHGLVAQIIKWAIANRYLRSQDQHTVAQLHLAREEDTVHDGGMTRPVAPEAIPPPEQVTSLAATAQAHFGQRTATMIWLLAYAGLRISECLALRNDDRLQRGEDGCWRIEIREQVHKAHRTLLPPKWRKRRWAFAPHWLTDDLTTLLADTPPGALLFPSAGSPRRQPDGTVERIGAGLHPYNNWRARIWVPLAEATPDWPERGDWWHPSNGPTPAGKQSERRWIWPAHALRHVCATYQLNTLGLDPDDVAKFLGHRSGVQVWEMYVRVRPDLFGRAAQASRQAGDPRTVR